EFGREFELCWRPRSIRTAGKGMWRHRSPTHVVATARSIARPACACNPQRQFVESLGDAARVAAPHTRSRRGAHTEARGSVTVREGCGKDRRIQSQPLLEGRLSHVTDRERTECAAAADLGP